jgi:hypothetical protein
MLDQGLAKKTQAKGHLCKPSRDEDSRKLRALICKPSRDEDSCKLRALLCKSSSDRDSRKLRAFMQTRRIYMENRISSLYGMARENGRKKENCEETDKKQKTDTHVMGRQRLIKLARPSTSHFAPLPTVGQPTPPPRHPTLTPRHPTSPPPPPFHTSSAGTWRSNSAPNRGHHWDLERMDPHSACISHASDMGSNHQ